MSNLLESFRFLIRSVLSCVGAGVDVPRLLEGNENQEEELLFLFVGLQKSGKTNAIKHIFGPTTVYKPSLTDVIEMTTKGVTIAEATGFRSSALTEDNMLITSSLTKYIQIHKKNSAASFWFFITAQLNEARFSGDSSEFSFALREIKKIIFRIIDPKQVQVVLVLTHADKPDIKDVLNHRIMDYKGVVADVLDEITACIILEDSHVDVKSIKKQSKENSYMSDLCNIITKIEKKKPKWKNNLRNLIGEE